METTLDKPKEITFPEAIAIIVYTAVMIPTLNAPLAMFVTFSSFIFTLGLPALWKKFH